MVFQPVDPVDAEIVPEEVEHGGHCEPGVPVLVDVGVEERMSADLGEEEREREDIDGRDSPEGGGNFLPDLVFEESGVMLQSTIIEEVVRCGAEDAVQRRGTETGNQEDGDTLSRDVVPRPERGGGWSWGGGVGRGCRVGRGVGRVDEWFQRAGNRRVREEERVETVEE
jgi:hypothetical protein